MHRITYELRQRNYPVPMVDAGSEPGEEFSWSVETQVVSGEPKVIAGTLRALANKLDPPEKAYR